MLKGKGLQIDWNQYIQTICHKEYKDWFENGVDFEVLSLGSMEWKKGKDGSFPEQPPELPVLWVVTLGGLDLPQFPFGEAVRLLSVK